MARVQIRSIINDRVSLPTIPNIVIRLRELLSDPEISLREIGQQLSKDPATAAKALRIANGAYFRPLERVDSIEHAAAVLGVQALEGIVMHASVIRAYEHLEKKSGVNLKDLWKHSILTGHLSFAIARKMPPGSCAFRPEVLYSCGLLHDIGKLGMLDSLDEEYAKVLRDSKSSGQALWKTEEQALGFNHMEVGTLIAAHWKLPHSIQLAILGHHGGLVDSKSHAEVAIVYLANRIAHVVEEGRLEEVRFLFPKAKHGLRISGRALAEVTAEAAERFLDMEV